MARRTTRTARTSSTHRLVDVISYIAVILVGVSITLALIDKLTDGAIRIGNVCNYIAQILAYVVLGVNSYYFALGRGTKHWRFIIWVIAIVLIIVVYVLNIVL